MPLAKIHIPMELNSAKCRVLTREVRRILVQELGVPSVRAKVLLCLSPRWCREVHFDRDNGFIFVEIMLFKGRSRECKEHLLFKIHKLILEYTNITGENIFINLQESERKDWGLLNGLMGDRISLGY